MISFALSFLTHCVRCVMVHYLDMLHTKCSAVACQAQSVRCMEKQERIVFTHTRYVTQRALCAASCSTAELVVAMMNALACPAHIVRCVGECVCINPPWYSVISATLTTNRS